MSFDFEINADPSKALGAIKQTEDGLDRLSAKGATLWQDAGGRWRDAEGRLVAVGGAAKGAGEEMERAAGHANTLLTALEAYVGLHSIEAVLDGYTEISNKIRVSTKDEENLNGVMEATLAIAQETRTRWEDIAGTYQRLSNVTKGLGLSQKEVLDLEEELAMAGKISGASQMESAMSMRELTHAFETGTLTAREYKVLMRDTPAMMNELRVASGLTSSQFSEMAKNGTLTAQKLIEWFGKAHDDVATKFGLLVPTISEDLTVLKNRAIQFFGEAGAGAGVMRALSDATQFLLRNFDAIGKTVIGVVEVLGGLFVIEKIITLVKLLGVAIAANPLGALVLATTLAISVLRQFGDEIFIDSRHVATLGDVFSTLWSYIVRAKDAIVDFVENAWHKLSDAFSTGLGTTGVELSLKNVMVFLASFGDAAIAIFRVIGDTLIMVFSHATTAIGLAFQTMLNGLINAANTMRQGLLDGLNDLDRMNAIHKAAQSENADYVRAFNAAMAAGRTDANTVAQAAVNATPWAERKKQAFAEAGLDSTGHQRAGGISEVEIVKPADAAAFRSTLGGKIDEDLKTSVLKDIVGKFFDAVDAKAAERIANTHPAGSTVDATKGTPEPIEASEKQIREFEKMRNELRAALEQTNPMIKAQEELAHVQEILTKAVAMHNPILDGMIEKYGGAGRVLDLMREKLRDQIDPLGALTRKHIEHAAALRDTTDAQELAKNVTADLDKLRKEGLAVTQQIVDRVTRENTVLEERKRLMATEQALTAEILGPQKTFLLNLTGLEDLYGRGRITLAQYQIALEKVKAAYVATTPEAKSFGQGVHDGLIAIRDEVFDVAKVISTALVNAFHSVENAIVALVVKGKADWHAMVESMLSDLTRLILRQAEGGLLGALGLGPPGHAIGGSWNVPGFASGGSAIVGGVGGIDSRLVAFRATPGERVTVETNDQQRANDRGRGGGGVTVINTHDPHAATMAALNTPAGEQLVMNAIVKNLTTLRGYINRK